jgi:uncharacterized cupredoxin-like copper-binding protein
LVPSNGARRRAAIPAVGLALIATVSGCGDRAPASARPVEVHLRDFAIETSKPTLNAGAVSFRVTNTGPETHELILVETDLDPSELPLEADGITVDEDAPQLREVTALEGIRLGQTRTVRVNLRPGHYVLFCNLEGHYLGLMHTAIDVTRPQTVK